MNDKSEDFRTTNIEESVDKRLWTADVYTTSQAIQAGRIEVEVGSITALFTPAKKAEDKKE